MLQRPAKGLARRRGRGARRRCCRGSRRTPRGRSRSAGSPRTPTSPARSPRPARSTAVLCARSPRTPARPDAGGRARAFRPPQRGQPGDRRGAPVPINVRRQGAPPVPAEDHTGAHKVNQNRHASSGGGVAIKRHPNVTVRRRWKGRSPSPLRRSRPHHSSLIAEESSSTDFNDHLCRDFD